MILTTRKTRSTEKLCKYITGFTSSKPISTIGGWWRELAALEGFVTVEIVDPTPLGVTGTFVNLRDHPSAVVEVLRRLASCVDGASHGAFAMTRSLRWNNPCRRPDVHVCVCSRGDWLRTRVYLEAVFDAAMREYFVRTEGAFDIALTSFFHTRASAFTLNICFVFSPLWLKEDEVMNFNFASEYCFMERVRLAANSCVTKDINLPGDYGGFPAVPVHEWRRQIAALRRTLK
ncbi:hypothetical protein RHMOL_Rhmol13G0209100 [Rhododendron molle]|uniref:Uncharacterized protein n=1 Tax=Rhododendron molle TaxID=49168 RepID=A0ACC0L9I8_RHOML|nr:hypothetical protein RHMOL_Rhmol13G0209100 [Rhododendron molle]